MKGKNSQLIFYIIAKVQKIETKKITKNCFFSQNN
jgi:hypothetical protein